MNVEEGADPVAGTVEVVQTHLPQVLPGKAVQAVPLDLGGEDGSGYAYHTCPHTSRSPTYFITNSRHKWEGTVACR